MATPVSTPAERTRLGVVAARVLSALGIVLGVLAWFVVIALGTASFSGQDTPHLPSDVLKVDVVGFAAAFAVAGTISGLTASATSGRSRWTIAFGAISVVVLAASVAILRWWIFRTTAPNVLWGDRVWNSCARTMEAGVVLGAISGLVFSGLVLAAAIVELHMTRWQFGLVVAVTTAVLGLGVLPLAVSQLSDLIIVYSGPNFRYLYEEAMSATSIGAGTGGLVGAVVVGMIARLFARTESRGGQPRQAAPSCAGDPVA